MKNLKGQSYRNTFTLKWKDLPYYSRTVNIHSGGKDSGMFNTKFLVIQ